MTWLTRRARNDLLRAFWKVTHPSKYLFDKDRTIGHRGGGGVGVATIRDIKEQKSYLRDVPL